MRFFVALFTLLFSPMCFAGNTIPLGTLVQAPATIANGGTASGAVPTFNSVLVGIQLPAAFTGTALTFQAATAVAGTYQTIKKADGTSLSYTVAQGTYVTIDPKDFQGVQFLKVVSGSAEGAARSLTLMLKGM